MQSQFVQIDKRNGEKQMNGQNPVRSLYSQAGRQVTSCNFSKIRATNLSKYTLHATPFSCNSLSDAVA